MIIPRICRRNHANIAMTTILLAAVSNSARGECATATVAAETNPRAVAVNPATGTVPLPNKGSNSVTVIDATAV
jgi:DNA-binding beta-propeller fold protein YncE